MFGDAGCLFDAVIRIFDLPGEIFVIRGQVKMTVPRQVEEHHALFPASFGIQGFIDRGADGVRRFRRGEDPLSLGKGHCRFKHILLPIWLASYRYQDKVYRFLVNGQSGEVQGERPWSVWKITFAVLCGLILAGLLFWLMSRR